MAATTAHFKYQVEKVAGKPSEKLVCGVFSKSLELASGETGLLGGCVVVGGPPAGGGEISTIDSGIFDLASSVLERESVGFLESFKSIEGKVAAYLAGRDFEVAFVLALWCRGACYMLRKGERVTVEVFEGAQARELGIHLGSGPVDDGQIYLIATRQCLDLFDLEILKDPAVDLLDVVDGMATEIAARDDSSGIGAVLVRVRADEVSGDGQPEDRRLITEGTEELHPSFAKASEGKESTEESEEEKAEAIEPHKREGVDDEVRIEGGITEGMEVLREGTEEDKSARIRGKIGGVMGKAALEVKGVFKGETGAIGSMRKKIVVMAILVVLVLGISVGFAVWQKGKAAKEAQVLQYLKEASEKYREASGLIELNRVRAREILIEAQNGAKKAQEIDSKNPELGKLASDIEAKLKETEINSQVNFEQLASFEEEIKVVAISGKNVIAAGASGVYQVGPDGKVQNVLTDLNGLVAGTVFDSKLYFINNDGAVRRDLSQGEPAKVADPGQALDIGVFFGNVYLLKNNQVAKIVPVEGGYAEPVDYLQGGYDFSQNSKMAIDSLIWVTNGSKILKFNRGKQEGFEIAGLTGSIGELGPIYTDGNLANLYVIDRGNSALLVIDKDGNFQKALQSPDFASAADLVVNDAEDMVYVAAGSKVLKASLK